MMARIRRTAGLVTTNLTASNSARSHSGSSQMRSASLDHGHTLAAALRILSLEDELAAERALTARLRARFADQDPPEP